MSQPEYKSRTGQTIFVRPPDLVALVWVVLGTAPVRVALPMGRKPAGAPVSAKTKDYMPACFYYDPTDADLRNFILSYQLALGPHPATDNSEIAEEYAEASTEPILSFCDIRQASVVTAALRYFLNRNGSETSPFTDPRMKESVDRLMDIISGLWKDAEKARGKHNYEHNNYDKTYNSGRRGGDDLGGAEDGSYQDQG